jgi:alpha-beta hydrolase superfamily lysophospholipase
MERLTGYFTSFDGTKLFFRCWLQSHANACVIVHGYGEHSGRYERIVADLGDVPYSFFCFDWRGQGRSEGSRVDAASFDEFLGDLDAFLRFLRASGRLVTPRLAILGHSLGGLLAARFAELHPEALGGLVLTSPCFGLAGPSGSWLVQCFSKMLARLSPRMVLWNFVTPRHLFHGWEAMAQYKADGLIERRVTARLGDLILRECARTSKRVMRLSIPVLVLASGNDFVVSLEATERWFENLEAPQKRMNSFFELYHEILHEAERAGPLGELRQFLNMIRDEK